MVASRAASSTFDLDYYLNSHTMRELRLLPAAPPHPRQRRLPAVVLRSKG